MKAAQLIKYGGQDSIQINEAEKPELKTGQVLVAVKAAGVNPFDYKVRQGYMKDFINLKLPATLGGDLAGVVDKIGENVSGFEVGQEVYGMAGAASGNGSYAEYAPVSAKQLVAKPNNVDFITAGALPLAALSAYQGVVEHIDIQPGQKILIHGGGGGIGSLAIQFAKNAGAYVATTASSDDTEFVKQLGADEVIDYKTQDFSTILKDFDAVFDTVGGETNKKSYTVLKSGGIFVSMVEDFDEELVRQTGVNYIYQSTVPTVKSLKIIAELVDAGKLKVNVDKVFALDQAAAALEYLGVGHPRGKVVIKVAD